MPPAQGCHFCSLGPLVVVEVTFGLNGAYGVKSFPYTYVTNGLPNPVFKTVTESEVVKPSISGIQIYIPQSVLDSNPCKCQAVDNIELAVQLRSVGSGLDNSPGGSGVLVMLATSENGTGSATRQLSVWYCAFPIVVPGVVVSLHWSGRCGMEAWALKERLSLMGINTIPMRE